MGVIRWKSVAESSVNSEGSMIANFPSFFREVSPSELIKRVTMHTSSMDKKSLLLEEEIFVRQYVQMILDMALQGNQLGWRFSFDTPEQGTLLKGKALKPFAGVKSSVMYLRKELKTKKPKKPVKFLFYDKGIGVFRDSEGQKVTAKEEIYSDEKPPLATVKDLVYLSYRELMLYTPNSTYQQRQNPTTNQKKCGPECLQVALDALTGILKLIRMPINEETINTWTPDRLRKVQRLPVVWSKKPRKKRKVPFDAISVSGDRPQSEGHYLKHTSRFDQEFHGYVVVPAKSGRRKNKVLVPTLVTTPTQVKGQVNKSEDAKKPSDKAVLDILASSRWIDQSDLPKKVDPTKKPGEIGFKAFNFAPLAKPTSKADRPVKGYRVWLYRRSRKNALQVNKSSPSPTAGRNDSHSQPSAGENGKWGTTPRLTFYQPMQLMHRDYDNECEPRGPAKPAVDSKGNPIYMNRKEVNLRTVSLPKKGRIKLTALPYELDNFANPEYYDERREAAAKRDMMARYAEYYTGPSLPSVSVHQSKTKGALIRNKTILKQVKSDVKRMEKEEQVTDQLRNMIEEENLDSLIGQLLDYQMTEVPNINSNIQNFVKVQTSNNSNRVGSSNSSSNNSSQNNNNDNNNNIDNNDYNNNDYNNNNNDQRPESINKMSGHNEDRPTDKKITQRTRKKLDICLTGAVPSQKVCTLPSNSKTKKQRYNSFHGPQSTSYTPRGNDDDSNSTSSNNSFRGGHTSSMTPKYHKKPINDNTSKKDTVAIKKKTTKPSSKSLKRATSKTPYMWLTMSPTDSYLTDNAVITADDSEDDGMIRRSFNNDKYKPFKEEFSLHHIIKNAQKIACPSQKMFYPGVKDECLEP